MTDRQIAVERMAEVLGRVEAAVIKYYGPALKSVQGYADEYHERLSSAVVAVFNGDSQYTSLLSTHKQLIRDYARDIYVEGMRDGGIKDAENELDDDDESAITAFINEQIGFALDFAKACADTRKAEDQKAAQTVINHRVEMWADRMRDFGNTGKIRAMEGEKARWELGQTEVHCTDCLANSKRTPQRMAVWRDNIGLPRNAELECHGYNCDCSLVSVRTGKVLFP